MATPPPYLKRNLNFVSVMIALLLGAAIAQQATPPVDPARTETGMVRFVNLSPNATPVTFALSNADGVVVTMAAEEALAYGAQSDYYEVPAGEYEMTVSVGDASSQLPPGFTAPYLVVAPNDLGVADDSYQTVVVMGLLVPETFDDVDDESGFVGWLRDLFGGDTPADRDALGLRVEVLDDDLGAEFGAGEGRVRVVHAAPGATAVDLVSLGDAGVVAGDVAFGQVSGFHTLEADDLSLAVRATGSDAELANLSTQSLGAGSSHTIFLIGTPFEGVPLEAKVLTSAPLATQ